MNKSKRMVADLPQREEKPQAKAVGSCSAHDCPLPGSMRPENGEPICGVHFLANPKGWPKATAVILDHLRLHDMARQAQLCGTPMSASHESATHLFNAAKAHGLVFNDEQRANYKRAGMKLRAAGEIVEATISALAVKAAFVAPESNADYSHEREMSAFNLAVRGLTNNLRLAA